MSNTRKIRYIESLAVSLIALWLLLTEDFAAWQNADIFFGVTEGYVWLGSTNAFPFAQIVILPLAACLGYIIYVSYRGYSENDTPEPLLKKVNRVIKIELEITLIAALLFAIIARNADWWWFGAGFYGSLVGGIANFWIYRQLSKV